MNLSTEDDVLNFYNTVMAKYIIRNPNQYYIQIIPSASGFIDNKFLRVSNVKNFATIDSEIRKNNFVIQMMKKFYLILIFYYMIMILLNLLKIIAIGLL